MTLLQLQIADLLSSELRSKKAARMLPLFAIDGKYAATESIEVSARTGVWECASQRSECAESDRPQLKVLELGGQNGLDVLGIAGEEKPIPHNVRLKREHRPGLLLGCRVKSFVDVIQQLSGVVGLDELDDIYDSRWIWAGICGSRPTSQRPGSGCRLVLGNQKGNQPVNDIGRQRPHDKRENRPHDADVDEKSQRRRQESQVLESKSPNIRSIRLQPNEACAPAWRLVVSRQGLLWNLLNGMASRGGYELVMSPWKPSVHVGRPTRVGAK